MKILFASKNEGKIKEVKGILSEFEIVSFIDLGVSTEIEEDGRNYWENAFKKAKIAFELTGIPCISDDSGLEVDFLDGAPGKISARYGGFYGNFGRKIELVLDALKGVPFEKRRARFVCVASYFDGKNKLFAEGILEGHISEKPKGSFGFGFDPIFYIAELNKTVAELPPEIKNQISHRGKAMRKLAKLIKDIFQK